MIQHLGDGHDNARPVLPPLLKWPGGKRDLLKHLSLLVPKSFNRYFEPFLGGGALFFSICAYPATLSDANEDLIECYRAIRDKPTEVVAHLRKLKNTKTAYLRVRESHPRTTVGRAARLVYLTTLSFNGIYRVNLDGVFNVPYGWKKHLDVVQESRILETSAALRGRTLMCEDFEAAVAGATKGDLV